MADEEIVVAIDAPEDTGVVERPEPKPAELAKAEPQAPEDEGITSLKSQLAAMQAGKDRAEADARQQREDAERVRQELEKTRGETVDIQSSALDSSISAAKAEADTAVRDYQTAMEQGEFAKAAEAQRKISRAEARVVRLEEAKADLETRKAEPEREVQQQPARQSAVDPFEAAIAGNTPRAQTWLRNHKEFVTDPKLNKKAQAAHLSAEAEGYIPDSDAYFDYCEQFLGLKEKPVDPAPAKPAPRKPAMPAAPVSRDLSNNGNLGNGQVVLTPGEQRAATDGSVVWNWDDPSGKFKKGEPVGLREFARRKALMAAEGRYASNYTEQ